MKRLAAVLAGLVGTVLCGCIVGVSTPTPIHSETIDNFSCNDITRQANGVYLLAGAQQVGTQSWEVEPGITVRGAGSGENNYYVDGMDVANISQGTFTSLTDDVITEAQVVTAGYVADYGSGGGAVINMVTKSGTNQFTMDYVAQTDASLNDLEYSEDDTLWGAGTTFDPDPVPVLGYFDAHGVFMHVDHPLEARGGFFNGVKFMGSGGVAYGNTSPIVDPIRPLLMTSPDGVAWTEPSNLPWMVGAINAAQFFDVYTGWVAGETPDGAAFATTTNGGQTWTSQTMPNATYIWDVEIAQIPVDPPACNTSWTLGAAIGTYYLDDGSKESIVYRYDGSVWEELWRVPGYGGALHFDTIGNGEIDIVQNHQDGTATFSRYAAHDFFATDDLVCSLEIAQDPSPAHPDEAIKLQLVVRGPWGGTLTVDTVVWSSDLGELGKLEVNPDDPLLATLTVSEPSEVRVTCALPDADLQTSQIVVVTSYD